MIRTRIVLAAAGLATAAGLLCGCSSHPAAAQRPHPATAATATPGPTSSWTPDAAPFTTQEQAVRAAQAAMTAFADHDHPYSVWWATLSPHLTAQAQNAWAFTNPALVPVDTITGIPHITGTYNATDVAVDIPTNAGIWRVDMIRQVEPPAAPGPWIVQAITPPESTR